MMCRKRSRFLLSVAFCFILPPSSQYNIAVDAEIIRRHDPTLTRIKRRLTRSRLQSATKQSRALFHENRQRGTVLAWFHKPTKNDITTWFGSDFGARPAFNHDMAGMTNPCVSISQPQQQTAQSQEVIPASRRRTTTSSTSTSTTWWPSTAIPDDALQAANWQILRLQQCVGQGPLCYQQVRDAVLNWEFATNSQGIAQVHPPESRRGDYSVRAVLLDNPYHPMVSDTVLQIWQGPGKRLVTFAKSKFLPCVFAVNPVSVVYNVVDQDAPSFQEPTMYSSTAYATLRGHWLQGEERVSVVMRNNNLVDVEILSISRPKTIMGKLAWPFIQGLQRDFFVKQLQEIQRSASDKP